MGHYEFCRKIDIILELQKQIYTGFSDDKAYSTGYGFLKEREILDKKQALEQAEKSINLYKTEVEK